MLCNGWKDAKAVIFVIISKRVCLRWWTRGSGFGQYCFGFLTLYDALHNVEVFFLRFCRGKESCSMSLTS
jgi:hypothetical protein